MKKLLIVILIAMSVPVIFSCASLLGFIKVKPVVHEDKENKIRYEFDYYEPEANPTVESGRNVFVEQLPPDGCKFYCFYIKGENNGKAYVIDLNKINVTSSAGKIYYPIYSQIVFNYTPYSPGSLNKNPTFVTGQVTPFRDTIREDKGFMIYLWIVIPENETPAVIEILGTKGGLAKI